MRVRVPERLPRPLSDEQIDVLLAQLRSRRDVALTLLLLDGGLRPGEVLGLCLDDIVWGRRYLVVRPRDGGSPRARAKGRRERVVDLHERRTLAALRDYIMNERPRDADSPHIFLVGGKGQRRCQPLSYAALVKMFARSCERAGIRTRLTTPHALRHTHATRMWEGGMRELALMKRLGHASPSSTAIYTRVSDSAVAREYQKAMGADQGDDCD